MERCNDNTSFDSRGRVKGAGNSNVLRDYYFTDSDNNDPVYYYRLRQFDLNGQAHLSPVIALSRKDENKVSFKLIPNPVGKSEQLLAVFNGLQQGESVLRIADMTGRVIIKKSITISNGNQLDFISIDDTIETGCYMVTLISPFETISSRLIVQ